MKNIIFLAVVFACVLSSRVSAQSALDSLLAELPNAQNDTNHVLLLTKISMKYARVDPVQGVEYGKAGLALARELQWRKGAAKAGQFLAYNFHLSGSQDSAIHYYKEAGKDAEAIGMTSDIARVALGLGLVYERIGEPEKALDQYVLASERYGSIGEQDRMAQALNNAAGMQLDMGRHNDALDTYREVEQLSIEAELPDKQARAYRGMSDVYIALSNYPKALEHALAARDVYEEQGSDSDVAVMETSIAVIFQEQEHYDEALEHYDKSLAIHTEREDHYNIGLGLNNIGSVHHSLEAYDKALDLYERALVEFELAEDPEGSALAIYNMGAIHKAKGDYERAFELLKRARGLFNEFGDRGRAAVSNGEIGSIYQRIANDDDPQVRKSFSMSSTTMSMKLALTYTDSAVQQLRVVDDIWNLKYYLQQKSNIDEALGNNESALKSYKEYTLLNDSIFNLEKDKKLVQVDLKYGFAIRENELEQQRLREAAVAEAEVQRQRTIRNFSLLGGGGILLFAVALFRQRNRIKREKARSDELLLNILPEEVAEELKEKGAAEAQLIDHVTVLFTDFKGFTAMSEQLSPKELVHDLNVCFSEFDKITTKYDIEKIKTIGDAYMAAGGLPTPNTTHATDVIKAALEMRDFVAAGKARKVEAGLPYFEVRIGIHTGPVVAGIVGVKKFSYDIWGDTVNTASRMESSGEAGQVNISEATYELVKDEPGLSFTSRGKVQAKGKGEMEMFFVSEEG